MPQQGSFSRYDCSNNPLCTTEIALILLSAEMKHITASVLFLGCLVALCGADDVVRRPSGIPTFVPPSTNFSGPAFLKWAFKQNRTSDGYLHVGVQQGEYDVYTNGVPMFDFAFVNNITFWLDDVILTFRTRLSRFAVQVGVTENIAIRGMTVHFNPPEMTQAIIDNITQVNSYTWIANATVCDGYPTAFVPGPKVKLLITNTMTDSLRPVGVTENIAIRGMTVHFNPPEMTQAIIDNITKINNNQWIANATVCDGYPTAFVPGPKTWYIYSGKTLQPTEPFRNCFDLWIPAGAKILSSDGKQFQLQLNAQQMANNNVNVGDVLATRGSGVTFFGIYESRNFSFIDVTITGSGAFGWYLESGYGGHVFQRVKIMRNPNPPIPGGVPPVLSLSADGLHVVGMKNGPIVIDSLFEGMGALFYPNSTTIVAKPPTYWSAGDIVRLYAANLEPLGFSQIVSITILPDKNSTIVLTTPHGNATYISDRSNANANFVISNNTFYNHRARSILCKGSRGVISNNIFNLTSLGAIFIATGPGEGDYSTDLMVANNYLENIGASSNNGYGGSISVNLDSTYIPLAGAFINISIVNNTVKGSWGRPLTVYSSANTSVIGNQFVAPFRSNYALMTFQNNAGLIVRDNCAVGNSSGVQFVNPNTTTGIQVCVPPSTFTTSSTSSTSTSSTSSVSDINSNTLQTQSTTKSNETTILSTSTASVLHLSFFLFLLSLF
ncbi:YadA domain-containing protein [Planoprotostelium fungivorum]|uniref:YadA domain-containing protein n=1 Tax=Planoprotostelium fungivorum TaxID=1890364 RepID=A0A2P6P0M8_9EUKA|nr:YadA domain-containing protein [Planoprotostelium fungivorum]